MNRPRSLISNAAMISPLLLTPAFADHYQIVLFDHQFDVEQMTRIIQRQQARYKRRQHRSFAIKRHQNGVSGQRDICGFGRRQGLRQPGNSHLREYCKSQQGTAA